MVTFSMSSCLDKNKDEDLFDAAAQYRKEVDAIDSYLLSNNIAHVKDLSGIRIVPVSLGSQLPAQASSSIDVDYKGSLLSTGALFEEGNAKGFLADFIPGWQIALRKLPAGSTATLYIPSYYGYGNTEKTKIPANSTLVFELKINSVTQGSVYKDKFTSDTTAIKTYIANKGLVAEKAPSGVWYINQLEGTGATPSWFNTVKIKYTFTLLSDDSQSVGTYDREPSDEFASFVVDYIQGVQVALMKMKAGGKMRLFIPSGLGFGINNATDGTTRIIIPANSNLIVDLELLEVY
jgi:FKBP-type peptidyl-prolyl cis-trans isomerase FkpA